MAFPDLTGFLNPAFNWLGSSAGNPGFVSGAAGKIRNAFTGANGTGKGWSWLGNNGVIPVGLAALQTLGGLGDWWLGTQNYNLAKDAYEFQTALANRNLANQAKLINNRYDTAATVGAQLSGYDYDRALASQQDQARKQHVDGSYIG